MIPRFDHAPPPARDDNFVDGSTVVLLICVALSFVAAAVLGVTLP